MSYTPSTKNYDAETAIDRYHIVKPGTNDGQVAPAAASTDALIGVTTEVDLDAGGSADVHHSGVAQVKLGGAVTAGDLLTADADGQGVAAAPAAGSNTSVIGRALSSGVDGDIIYLALAPSQIQG